MSKQRLVILIIAAVGVLAVFMPWVNMPLIGSVNGARGYGWFIFALYVIPVLLSLLGDRTKPLAGWNLYGSMIAGGVASILAIWKAIDFMSSVSGDNSDEFSSMFSDAVSLGFGIYLVMAAGIGIIIASLLVKEKPKTE